jgi:hypothetical protein
MSAQDYYGQQQGGGGGGYGQQQNYGQGGQQNYQQGQVRRSKNILASRLTSNSSSPKP